MVRECLNDFCIYQKSEECTLDDISVGADGTCADMIFVHLNETYLDAAKSAVRKELDEAFNEIRREYQ